MGKRKKTTIENIKELLLIHNVELFVHDDLEKDLKKFDPSNLKIMIALVLKRVEKGLTIPPAEPLSGSDLNGYAKIKDRTFPYRGVYTFKEIDNGRMAMYLIAVGPKEKDKVYDIAASRTSDPNEYFDLKK